MFRAIRYGTLVAALAIPMLPNDCFYARGGAGKPKETEGNHEEAHAKDAEVHAKHAEAQPNPHNDAAVEERAKANKSIVPNKYAGKYKGGHAEGDALGALIVKHSQKSYKDGETEKSEFHFPTFFDLMEKNGVAKEHVDVFRKGVEDKAPGVQGRARMTLRNRVETIVRDRGHFIGLDDKKHDVKVPPRANVRPPKAEAKAEEGKEPAAA